MTLRAGIRLVLLTIFLLPVSASAQRQSAEPVAPGQTRQQAQQQTQAQAQPASSTYVFPSGRERARYWALQAMGPLALGSAVIGASWGTWVRNEPPEWGKSGEGFGRRFGNSLATTAINQTSLALISEATRQDPIYYRCPCNGFGPRLKHVIKMTFMARNRSGDLVFSPGKTFSPFVGPMVTRNTLYPDRYGPGDAAISGAYGVGSSMAWNFAREFILPAKRW